MADCHHWEAKLIGEVPILGYVSERLMVDDPHTEYDYSGLSLTDMEQLNHTKFYQLGNGGSLIFERDLEALAEFLECPHPEFFGAQVNDQPGGELQWVIVADLRGKIEPPMSERIQFSVRDNNWLDGLARALQEALAQLKYPVEHLDFMLTRKELDNSHAYANQTHLHQSQQSETIKILAKERKSLRQQRAKKDYIIARLRAKIASLEETVKAQETQLKDLEGEGEDIQGGGTSYLSDDDDFEEAKDLDFHTDVEGYEFMEAGVDDFILIDVDEEE
ncbi:hypothetical protein QYE76_035051 [Lolium multiflorum]|uniref:Uncharacterized protein n=1 Tax=Lolium multiflorum TaxID=4521 RepID=A0AAD8QYH4_LOLMU|nr:hypothetical protein QYE76_035051 [Lolium multiflorum]